MDDNRENSCKHETEIISDDTETSPSESACPVQENVSDEENIRSADEAYAAPDEQNENSAASGEIHPDCSPEENAPLPEEVPCGDYPPDSPVSDSAQDGIVPGDVPSEDSGDNEASDDSKAGKFRLQNFKLSGVRLACVIAAGVIIILFAAYCVLCAAVKNSDTILSNSGVDGVDVGGLTCDEAAALLEEELSQDLEDTVIYVSALDETYTVSLGDVLETDWQSLAQSCYEYGHSAFISAGWCWLSSKISSRDAESEPYAAYESELASAISDSGLADINTVVETTWEVTDGGVVISMGTDGQKADTDALSELIFAAIDEGDFETVIDCPMEDVEPADIDLDSVYEEIYVEPQNATLDADNSYSVVESVTGVSFDLDAAQSSVEDAQSGETVTIEFVYTEPEITTETLEANLFKDTLGTYTTTVSGSSARKNNVKLASSSCSGVILLPGETFSFNGTVGQRTTAKGYQAASAYVSGETVDTIGGGICQVSSTLYVACLYANLEITERHNHSYTVSYMPLGWDATVSWGGPDFQFTNNTNYPIKIVANYSSSNTLTMSIIGTDETGYSVKIVSETYSSTAYSTEEIEDDTLEAGTTVVEQSGYTGYTVQTWRYVYDSDGNLISDDKEAYSTYKKRNKIIRVGTKVSETEESQEDDGEDDSAQDTGQTTEAEQ